ncbi:MAG: tRNA lysidine(34) synthetase TilS [Dehalococcoidia bacterium]
MDAGEQRAARRLERRVLRFIREQDLAEVDSDHRWLLAVSGGADSLTLLHIMARLAGELGLTLVVAYVDHGIRPPEAIAAEQAFVEAQARALGLPFLAGRARPDGPLGDRRSPEDAARRGRYTSLAAVAAWAGAGCVATGHTRSDQAETVLLRLLRGSGMRGLAAMAPDAPWPVAAVHPPRLVRPLLGLDREETAAYCRARCLEPRLDPENSNPRYLRNRVRAEVMPVLRSLNPRIEAVLAQLADELRSLRNEPETAVLGAGGADAPAPLQIDLDIEDLRAAQPAVRTARLRGALQAAMPGKGAPSRAHLRALDDLALGPDGRSVDLPHGRRARRQGAVLSIGPRRAQGREVLPEEQPVPVPGELALPGWRVHTTLVATAERGLVVGPWAALLDAGLAPSLTVGRRRPGERMRLAGMTGRKRLQDLFIDSKVPREERDRRPVFRTDRGVAWVAGLRVAAWAGAGDGPALLVQVVPDQADANAEIAGS